MAAIESHGLSKGFDTPARTASRKRATGALAGLVTALVVTASACVGSHFTTYKSFTSALNKGASCAELFDQREHFDNPRTLAKVDRDLDRIGCTSRDAVRNDR
jgi:hypothetical protein